MIDDDVDDSSGAPPETSEAAPASMTVDVGNALPVVRPKRMPVLQPQYQSIQGTDLDDSGPGMSKLADGLRFEGNAVLNGPCSMGGEFNGNLTQAPNAVVSVVVTETGCVTGDVTAQKISVMGRTNGVLDAGQGEVTLHDSASVKGLVRYGRIQVNGADLNATLERVALDKRVD